jgi:hypothetical protein
MTRSASSSPALGCLSGTKEVLRGRIEEALDDGSLVISQIVQFLDSAIPWGKQHVYLYKGPQSWIADWRTESCFSRLLKKHRLGKYLNASLPLVLPDTIKVSSILHDSKRQESPIRPSEADSRRVKTTCSALFGTSGRLRKSH